MTLSEKRAKHLPLTQKEIAIALRHTLNLRIVALGDSSVFGVGDHGDEIPSVGYGWTGRLAHDLSAERFVNVAKNGARARHLTQSQLPAALALGPHIALICIGTNDVLRGDFSPLEIRKCLTEISSRLAESGALVVLLGLPDPIRTAPGPMALRRILSDRVIIVNEIIREAAEDGNALVVPTWDSKIAHERKMWHVDRMHPSALGHQHIADLVRRNLSLPRRSSKKISIDSGKSKRHELYWLLTNGAKWFAKRSLDLVPALIWLMVSENLLRHARKKAKRKSSSLN
jgi:lysophospholipase L1-like esterase